MNHTIKNILIYVETGGPSLTVAEKGIKLAKELNAQVSLLYVTDTDIPNHGEEAKEILEKDRDRAKKFLTQILHVYGCPALVYMEEGDPLKKIIEKGKLVSADIVVISKYSRRRANGKPAGYLAEEIMNDSDLKVVPL